MAARGLRTADPLKVWYVSDVVLGDLNNNISVSEHIHSGTNKSDGNSSQPAESGQQTIGNINSENPLLRFPKIYVINIPMNYIGRRFT